MHREASGVRDRQTLKVTLALDTAPREVDVPADLTSALKKAKVLAAFEAKSFTTRKEWVRGVEGEGARDAGAADCEGGGVAAGLTARAVAVSPAPGDNPEAGDDAELPSTPSASSAKWRITEFALLKHRAARRLRPRATWTCWCRSRQGLVTGLFDLVHMEDELRAIFGRDVDLVTRRAVERGTNARGAGRPSWIR
ncbi:MAG: hypothetical protein U0P30_00055 [Vicinamibacterales bacterium]